MTQPVRGGLATERPTGVTILAGIYVVLGGSLLLMPIYPWPAWQTESVALVGTALSIGVVKCLCVLLGLGLMITSVLLLRQSRIGVLLSTIGLAVAVVMDLLSGRLGAAMLDGIQLGYLWSVRESFRVLD